MRYFILALVFIFAIMACASTQATEKPKKRVTEIPYIPAK